MGGAPVDDPEPALLATQEYVLADGQLRNEGELLVDDGDTRPLALRDIAELPCLV